MVYKVLSLTQQDSFTKENALDAVLGKKWPKSQGVLHWAASHMGTLPLVGFRLTKRQTRLSPGRGLLMRRLE